MAPSVEVAPAAQEVKKDVIGFIYPPPEVRNIVDKTASFVARNGVEFESKIRMNEQSNPKFNFLNPGDPYHAYYQHKVQESRSGVSQGIPAKDGPSHGLVSLSTQQKQQELLRIVSASSVPLISKDPPKEPPPDYEFVSDPPSISAYDLDIVRLTAQFVARNGRQFLTTLMNREQRNSQFDFLRPQHSLFQYFTRLLEQYTKVLIPPKDLMKKLAKEARNPKSVFEQVEKRVEWRQYQLALRKKEEEAVEKERVEYTSIDWHGFSPVETIDYQPWESGTFPPPTNPEEVGRRVLAQDRLDEGLPEEDDHHSDDGNVAAGDDTQVQDMEEASSSEEDDDDDDDDDDNTSSSSSSEDEDVPKLPPSPPPAASKAMPPPPSQAIQPIPELPKPGRVIVRDYDPRKNKAAKDPKADQFLVSPITGEKISASDVDQHLKISMLDPRWLENKKKQEKESISQDNVFAGGDSVKSSLKLLAERRTDIFGAGDEETMIGRKIGEAETRKEDNSKIIWDGHSNSIEASTRAARANISINDQIQQIHKVQGLVLDKNKEKIGPKPQGGAKNDLPAPPQHKPPPLPPQPPQPPSNPPLPPPPGNEPTPPQPPQQQMIRPPMGGPMPPQGPMNPNMMRMPGMMMMPRPPMMMMMPGPNFMPGFPMPPMPGPGPAMPPMPQQQPQQPPVPPGVSMVQDMDDDDGGPSAKRQRMEGNLVPEAEWSRKYPGIVKFRVSVPESTDKSTDKQEWRLNGQNIHCAFSLAEQVSTLKAFVSEQTGLPPAKQKLVKEGTFFKDLATLAAYNIAPGCVVQLQVKERGGRKK